MTEISLLTLLCGCRVYTLLYVRTSKWQQLQQTLYAYAGPPLSPITHCVSSCHDSVLH